MRTILSLFVVLLFAAGCGSGGENTDTEQVDCSDPVFTRTEPLPSGTHPEDWITTGNSYWTCGGDKQFFNADGTVTGRLADADTHTTLTIWRACRRGTRPPEFAGNWVVVDETICIRSDAVPGIIVCTDIFSEPDGVSYTVGGDTRVIQYGREVSNSYEESETCYLEEE